MYAVRLNTPASVFHRLWITPTPLHRLWINLWITFRRKAGANSTFGTYTN
jgi:hypothetical protein